MSLDLKGILNSTTTVQPNGPANKKNRVDNGTHYFEVTGINLHQIRTALKLKLDNGNNLNISQVEVEIRLGMIVDRSRRWRSKIHEKNAVTVDDRNRAAGLQFKSGVDPIFARKLRKILTSNDFKADIQPLQKLRCDDNNNRWHIDKHGAVSMPERKDVLMRLDVALLAHDYDIRMNGAYENDLTSTDGSSLSKGVNINYSNWTQERTKRRVSYVHKVYSSWRIDFTEVDILFQGGVAAGAKAKEIEVEFELGQDAKAQWVQETDEKAAVQRTRDLASELVKLIDLFVPFNSEEGSHAEPMTLANSPELDRELSATNALVQVNRKGFEFLGSMPVNLSRQNLASVVNSKYFLTEKSDGVRYLMYVVHDPKAGKPVAVLVDRTKKAFSFRGSEAIGSMLAVGSILDGELVYNLSFRENVFLVFDVLAWAGRSLVNEDFSQRTAVVETQVMRMYADNLNKLPQPLHTDPKRPVLLVRKAFVDKAQLSELLGKITLVGSDRVFRENERRHHRSDGLIFQPDAPYVFSRHYDLLKWKWAELRSVDLQVVVDQSSQDAPSIHLICSGDSETQVNCTRRGDKNIGLGVYDSLRLMADMLDGAGRMTAIAEVAYDVGVGMWEYLHLRTDKNEPNFIATVMGVFMEQAESIGVEELEYIVTAASHNLENDYERQLAGMKAKLLTWQRKIVKEKSNTIC